MTDSTAGEAEWALNALRGQMLAALGSDEPSHGSVCDLWWQVERAIDAALARLSSDAQAAALEKMREALAEVDEVLTDMGWHKDRGLLSRVRAALSPPATPLPDDAFPKPRRNDGGTPCGECHLPVGEVCDICGATHPPPSATPPENAEGDRSPSIGTRVRKLSGSSWHGRVVGHYSTTLTPRGICVESEREPGSVQIYPLKALEVVPPESAEGE